MYASFDKILKQAMLFANSRVLHSLSVSSVPSVYPLRNKKKSSMAEELKQRKEEPEKWEESSKEEHY
jgi:hypothetical protein